MSAFTDAFSAAVTNLQAQIKNGPGITKDDAIAAAHSVVDPAIADLTAKVNTINSSESDDATKLADIQAALSGFSIAFGPASTPAPAPVAGTAADSGAATDGSTAAAS